MDDVLSDNNYDSNLVASSDDDSDLEFDPNCEIVDVGDVRVFSYDQDDLEIKVNVVFSYTNECCQNFEQQVRGGKCPESY